MQLPVTRGRLRVYLGVAPGAGATCALLSEGHRRAEQAADVVVASVRTGGRPATIENATQLVLGRRHRSRLAALRPRTRIRSRVIRGSSGTDVHIITYPASLTARPAACEPDRNGRRANDHVPGKAALPAGRMAKAAPVRY